MIFHASQLTPHAVMNDTQEHQRATVGCTKPFSGGKDNEVSTD